MKNDSDVNLFKNCKYKYGEDLIIFNSGKTYRKYVLENIRLGKSFEVTPDIIGECFDYTIMTQLYKNDYELVSKVEEIELLANDDVDMLIEKEYVVIYPNGKILVTYKSKEYHGILSSVLYLMRNHYCYFKGRSVYLKKDCLL